jgi:class 3 adenylate cyclase
MLEVVQAALGSDDDLVHFEIRIGIHTGPVVAGIVGIKKWQYDIWGDTVNIAARMESASKPGRINLSESTFLEIQDEFPCEYRGEIEVKNRGALRMYFLS